jgi:putative MFS transporter
MLVQSASMGYRMAGMPMSGTMWLEIAVIVLGLVVAACGLIPRSTGSSTGKGRYVLRTNGAVRLGAPHKRLIAVLSFSLIVDQMKPATVAFIVPGMRAEYGISAGQVALMPTSALTGTVVGSLLWGYLADRIGRRAGILLATLLFVSTTVCGAMPSFEGNLVMCALMGMSAGGMLPIVYALMAETIPTRSRSAIMVLQAGLTTVVGYLAASGLATVFIPLVTWRVLWFVQLPFALTMLVLNQWIPESPGFLLMRGRVREANDVARWFGAEVVPQSETDRVPGQSEKAAGSSHVRALVSTAYRAQTLIIAGYAISWGIIYWGFITFLPSLLEEAGSIGSSGSRRLLFVSSLLSIPGTALVAWLYSAWSSRKTMCLYGGMTVLALVGLGAIPLGASKVADIVLLMLLLTGSSGVVAVLGPYTAEVYPTAFRGLGSGLSAACSKVGGMFGPPLVATLLLVLPGVRAVAPLVAVPMALAAGAVARGGRETSRQDVETAASHSSTPTPGVRS